MPAVSMPEIVGVSSPFLNHFDRELRHALLQEAVAQHGAALEGAPRVLARQLKLADGLVDQPHLLVGDPQVVVGLVVFGGELLLDALLELPKDLLQRHLALGRRDPARLFGQDLLGQLLLELLCEVEELLLVGEEIPFDRALGWTGPGPARCISSWRRFRAAAETNRVPGATNRGRQR
jgi:hypothetical protein